MTEGKRFPWLAVILGVGCLGILCVFIVVGLLFAVPRIYPNVKPVGEVATPEANGRPMVDDNAMGNPNAPIKMEQFSDYQCPFCARYFEETEGQVVEAYVATGKVYYVYRSFGAFIGPESQAAAEAAYCAGDQDKYWEYHDILFANQTGENVGAFADRRLQAFAEELSLDMEAFDSCFSGGKFTDRVEQDYVDGSGAGVTGTPGFLITYTVDGEERQRIIAGAYPFSEFQTQFDEALAEMGQ